MYRYTFSMTRGTCEVTFTFLSQNWSPHLKSWREKCICKPIHCISRAIIPSNLGLYCYYKTSSCLTCAIFLRATGFKYSNHLFSSLFQCIKLFEQLPFYQGLQKFLWPPHSCTALPYILFPSYQVWMLQNQICCSEDVVQ